MRLHLVRHGRPVIDPATPSRTWSLDPASYDDVWALRERLPVALHAAPWYTSPEPRAIETAQLLTDAQVGIVDGLREQHRGDPGDPATSGWVDDLAAAVRRAVERPDEPAVPGWEPLTSTRARVVGAVRPILAAHADEPDVVLVGHGTAWCLLAAELLGTAPDLERWARLALPDVVRLDLP